MISALQQRANPVRPHLLLRTLVSAPIDGELEDTMDARIDPALPHAFAADTGERLS